MLAGEYKKNLLFLILGLFVTIVPEMLFAESISMMFISGGEYEMGDHYSEVSGAPRHMVYISPFYISMYEVTNQQYCIFLNNADVKVVGGTIYAVSDGSNSYPYCDTHIKDTDSQISYSGETFAVLTKDGYDMSDHPVLHVSWYGAVAYCNYYGYRLPTEAEWEYAARGGRYSPYYRYPWGNNIDGSNANYSSSGDPYETETSPHTTPVGYYNGNQIPFGSDMANGYGLYDVAGNLKEWCSDWFDLNYYTVSPYDNPTGPANGSVRVVRGGAWTGNIDSCLVAIRDSTTPSNRNKHYGFRIVCSLSGPSGSPPSEDVHNGDRTDMMGFSDDPVNTATGNFFHSETDFSIKTRGIPLEFTRHYNSKSACDGSLGIGWTHSYNIKLTEDVNLVAVKWGDGRVDYWNPDGLGGYEPNLPNLYASLSKDGSIWTVKKKNLDSYTFNSDGLLTGISDKNGNTITLAYTHGSDPNLVTQITDPVGRTVTLAYNGSNLLESITDFASPARTVQYSYTAGKLTHVTDVLGNTISYTYDANGYLETITDQRGVTTVANVYDANGRVIQQADGNNNVSVFSYDTPNAGQTSIADPNGNVTIHTHFTNYKLLQAVQNPLGGIVSYLYDSKGNRAAITDRNGNLTGFEYDERGNVVKTINADSGITLVEYNDASFPDLPTKKTDALGNITTWEYDSRGNVTRQVDPNGFERSWTYNSFGQKLTETDENGHATLFAYDSDGLLTQITDPNGNNTWLGYDSLWRLTHVTDGRGSYVGNPDHTIVTAYDNADRIISITSPVTSQSYQYDTVGNRTNLINGRGFTTSYYYDNNNNLLRIERPAPGSQTQVIQYSYDKLDRKVSMTDPNGNISIYEYDNAGRLVKEINAEGDETIYTYDSHGNVISLTDGSGVTTTFEYDSMHRKIKHADELGNNWQWQYDKLGDLISHTDAMGNITKYEYDSLNRLVSVVDDSNDVTEYSYDAVGNLTQVKDGGGRIISHKYYDEANRLVRQEDGLGNAYVYAYDGTGNLTFVTDPNNQVKTMVYDNENRLVEIHYPDGNSVTYGYDNNGNLVSMADSTGSSVYAYDELDRLISSTDSFGKTVLYGYDIIGNRTSITYPSDSSKPARAVNYSYDSANRLDKITDWSARVWDYTTDRAGRITQLVYPNGVKKQQGFDDAGRLSSLVYKSSADVNLMTYTYARDAQANPIKIDETGTLQPGRFALLGNAYSYDDDNRLLSSVSASYSYDKKGNVTGKTEGSTTSVFVYNFENRLVSQSTNSSTVQHVYDGRGNRISRNDNNSEIRYVLDNGRDMSHILCETDSSGEIIAYYIHGPEIVGRIGSDGSLRCYHTNHIGSVVALSDDIGKIKDRYAYTPFGVSAGKECSVANPFTYIGGLGVMAENDGLYFMRARFYEADSGRFYGKDPVEGSLMQPMSLHRYGYAMNNANIYVDTNGKAAIIAIPAVEFIIDFSVLYVEMKSGDPVRQRRATVNLLPLGSGGVVNAIWDEIKGINVQEVKSYELLQMDFWSYTVVRSYIIQMKYYVGEIHSAYSYWRTNRGANTPSHESTNTDVQSKSYEIKCFGK